MSWTIPTATVHEFKRTRSVKPKIGAWAIQRGLNSIGYELVEDGIYGGTTAKAVRAQQGIWGLEVDGVFGTQSSIALANNLSINIGVGKLPPGLLDGIVDGESSRLICAINNDVAGGIDVSYLQRRVFAADYGNDAVIQRAFDGRYQLKLVKRTLIGRFEVFHGQPGAKTEERAWRLATLNHNWPYGAGKIAALGDDNLTPYFYTPQDWVLEIKAKFADGAPVRTPLERCQQYALGSPEHNDLGKMTKLVTDWSV